MIFLKFKESIKKYNHEITSTFCYREIGIVTENELMNIHDMSMLKSPGWLRAIQIGFGIIIVILSLIVILNPIVGFLSIIGF